MLPNEESILAEAMKLTSVDRNKAYGEPLDDYGKTVAAFNALTGHNLTVEQGVLFMVLVKLSREQHRPHRDNRVDAAGYIRCLDEVIQEKARRFGHPPPEEDFTRNDLVDSAWRDRNWEEGDRPMTEQAPQDAIRPANPTWQCCDCRLCFGPQQTPHLDLQRGTVCACCWLRRNTTLNPEAARA